MTSPNRRARFRFSQFYACIVNISVPPRISDDLVSPSIVAVDGTRSFDTQRRLLIVTGFAASVPKSACSIVFPHRLQSPFSYTVSLGARSTRGRWSLRCCPFILYLQREYTVRCFTMQLAGATIVIHSIKRPRSRCSADSSSLLPSLRYLASPLFFFLSFFPFNFQTPQRSHRKLCTGGIVLHACVIDTYLLAALIASWPLPLGRGAARNFAEAGLADRHVTVLTSTEKSKVRSLCLKLIPYFFPLPVSFLDISPFLSQVFLPTQFSFVRFVSIFFPDVSESGILSQASRLARIANNDPVLRLANRVAKPTDAG